METVKPWYTSKTLWGIVLAAVSFILSKFVGVQPDDIPIPANADFNTLQQVAHSVREAQGNTPALISAIMGGVFSIYAMYNRIVTSAKLK